MLTGPAEIPANLLARLVNQATTYGELMLTPTELATVAAWTEDHPNASCCAAGVTYVFDRLAVKVLHPLNYESRKR